MSIPAKNYQHLLYTPVCLENQAMPNTFIIEGNTYPALQSHQMHDAMYELPVYTFHPMDTVPIEKMPQLWPFSEQLTPLQGGTALILGEYPINAISVQVAEEQTYGTQISAIPSEILFTTENNLTYDTPTNVQYNIAQDSLNTQNNRFEKSPNANRCKQETLPMGCPDNIKVVKRRRIDKAARTIPFTKRKGTTSVVPIATTIVGHANNNYAMCNESQFCSNSSVVPLHDEDRRTVFKVVHPGKIDRFLFQELSQNRPNTIGTNVRKNTAPICIKKMLHKTELNTANVLSSSPAACENSSSKHAPSQNQVQTRSGRISKAPKMGNHSVESKFPLGHNRQPTTETGTTANDPRIYGDSLQLQNETNDDKENPNPLTGFKPRKRNIPAKFRCGTCHKTYLGRRMTRHLQSNPTHVTLDMLEQDTIESVLKPKPTMEKESLCSSSASAPEVPSESSPQLYRCLVDLVTTNEPERKRCDILLKEISQFVGLVRTRVPSLIVPSEQEDNEAVYVDQNVADVLQLNRGNYRFRLDAFLQERERLGGNTSVCDAATKTTKPKECEDATNNNCAEADDKFISHSFESLLQEIADLDRQEQQGVLKHLPLPEVTLEDDEISNIESPELLCEPPVLSQGTTAFGRPCQLSEELLLNQSNEELQAIEELTNLSELCSPQVLGVSGGASTSESTSALSFY